MSIIAKFQCGEVKEIKYPNGEKVTESIYMHATFGAENASWNSATPYGRLDLVIANKSAWGRFEPGKAYRITIEEFTPDMEFPK